MAIEMLLSGPGEEILPSSLYTKRSSFLCDYLLKVSLVDCLITPSQYIYNFFTFLNLPLGFPPNELFYFLTTVIELLPCFSLSTTTLALFSLSPNSWTTPFNRSRDFGSRV